LDLTSFAAGLKTVYTQKKIENLVYRNNPLLALMTKMENMVGDGYKLPVIYGSPQSRSSTFSTAQTLAATKYTGIKAFTVTRVKDYGVVNIDHETMLASKNDAGAFMQARVTEIDGAINAVTQSLATAQYRSGWGNIGQVNATVATATLTLSNSEDIVNFEPGMEIVFSSSESGAVLRSANSTTINSINRSAGTMVLSATVGDVCTASDYIFPAGDRQNSATPTRLKVAGLEAWIPSSAPAATAFFGVDRTTDSRLGGLRFDGASYTVEEALTKAAVVAAKEGAKVDHCMISYTKFADLVNSLGQKVNYVDLKTGDIGFQALRLYTPSGDVKVVPDRNCPSNRAFLIQLDTWMLGSIGPAVGILNYEGLEALRQASGDGIEVRVGFYGNVMCRAPGWNVNVQL
jgi:hypothetical protein